MKWRLISQKMVPSVVLASLIAGYLGYPRFCESILRFTCLLHPQSFQKPNSTLLQVLQPFNSVVLNVRFTTNEVCEKNIIHIICGANK